MKLHLGGVEPVTELLDVADHAELLKPTELKALLRETASVLGDLLAHEFREKEAAKSVASHKPSRFFKARA